MDTIIDIQQLSYSYNNNFKALDDISIQVPRGAVYGFLGPNGAGKSTTMRMLAGIMPDESGAIRVFGEPLGGQLPGVYAKIGCLVEQPVLYSHLTAKDHLELVLKSNGLALDKIDPILEMVGLTRAKHLAVKRYSLGMKQRLAIGLCLVKEPELLLLDEPVNGLDPNGMQEVREMLLRLNGQHGITIFISSHLLAELEKMCSHICIINKGKIHFQGTMQELKLKFEGTPVRISIGDYDGPVSLPGYEVLRKDHTITCHLQSRNEIPVIVRRLVEQGIPVYEVKQEGSLESWFMDIIQ